MRTQPVVRVVVVGGGYAGVELSCNLATELRGQGMGSAEVSLATNSEVFLAMAVVTVLMTRGFFEIHVSILHPVS